MSTTTRGPARFIKMHAWQCLRKMKAGSTHTIITTTLPQCIQLSAWLASFSTSSRRLYLSLSLRLSPSLSHGKALNLTVINMYVQANNTWSLKRISEFGYFRGHATKEELKLEVSVIFNISYQKRNSFICALLFYFIFFLLH